MLSDIRFGLVRLTAELTVVDKNKMADVIFPLPRRNGSVADIIKNSAKQLGELGKECGSAVAVTLKGDKIARNAVAFRERDGGILLLLHPLLSTVYFEKRDRTFKRMLSYYAQGIYAIIEEMERKSVFSSTRVASLQSVMPNDYSQRDYLSVKSAVKRAVDKVSAAVLKKKLTVVVDKIYARSARGVIFSKLEYALSELIVLRELYGESDDAVIEIGITEDCLSVTLRDRVAVDSVVHYYVRIFCEILKILDIGSYSRLNENGELTMRTFIPFARTNSLMCDDFKTELDQYGYFEYCLAYLNM